MVRVIWWVLCLSLSIDLYQIPRSRKCSSLAPSFPFQESLFFNSDSSWAWKLTSLQFSRLLTTNETPKRLAISALEFSLQSTSLSWCGLVFPVVRLKICHGMRLGFSLFVIHDNSIRSLLNCSGLKADQERPSGPRPCPCSTPNLACYCRYSLNLDEHRIWKNEKKKARVGGLTRITSLWLRKMQLVSCSCRPWLSCLALDRLPQENMRSANHWTRPSGVYDCLLCCRWISDVRFLNDANGGSHC